MIRNGSSLIMSEIDQSQSCRKVNRVTQEDEESNSQFQQQRIQLLPPNDQHIVHREIQGFHMFVKKTCVESHGPRNKIEKDHIRNQNDQQVAKNVPE